MFSYGWFLQAHQAFVHIPTDCCNKIFFFSMTNINMNCSFLIKLLKLFNYKSNRFQVAVHLFSSTSQLMTLKCGKNKKVTQGATQECITDVLSTVLCLFWSITEQTHSMESICFIWLKRKGSFNPLTPKISLVILLTVCHTVFAKLVLRIWYWIN